MTRTAPATSAGEVPDPHLLVAEGWRDYALLDSGAGRKLERFGPYSVIRPEPQALWAPARPEAAWAAAAARFEGGEDAGSRWRGGESLPAGWDMAYGPLRFEARLSAFRHLGVFPEQAVHWDWLAPLTVPGADGRRPEVLNLFGYTGLASLVAAHAGAAVTHLDASRKAIDWGRRNQALSGLDDAPIRWICDDAMKFLRREQRRGRRYDGIILDPPKYGRGPKGEVWDLYTDLPGLLAGCASLLRAEARFLVATAYAIRLSSVSLHLALAEALGGERGGTLDSGEMAVRDGAGRPLSAAVFARWQGGQAP